MRKGFAILFIVLLLAPTTFASDSRLNEPRLGLRQTIKRLIGKISAFDEILTGWKP